MIILIIKQPFFFNDGALLPMLAAAFAGGAGGGAGGVIGGDFPGSGFQRAGEAAGWGFTGVVADGGVGVRRGAGGAEDGCGVEWSGGFLSVVGVSGGALDVVHWTARWSRRRRWCDARHFGVRLRMHLLLLLLLLRMRISDSQGNPNANEMQMQMKCESKCKAQRFKSSSFFFFFFVLLSTSHGKLPCYQVRVYFLVVYYYYYLKKN